MWDHIINIHPSELSRKKTKESRINELLKKKKKKVLHNSCKDTEISPWVTLLGILLQWPTQSRFK